MPQITVRQNVKNMSTGFLSLSVVASLFVTIMMPMQVLAFEGSVAVNGGGDLVTVSEVSNALSHTKGVLGSSDQTKVTSDIDSAILASGAGTTVDVPKDASEGVTFGTSENSMIEISLPNADQSAKAQKVNNGTVAFAGNDGSANAVQATEDGGVRMLTIIDNVNAPTEYDYGVTVPGGGHIELVNGDAVVLDGNGNIISMVGTPWAKDATGKKVETYFTTDGQTLTQHVLHNVPGVVYPVTADPFWIAAWVLRACGIGFLGAGAGYYVSGGTSFWRFLASGGVGCVAGIIGKKW